jgi:hypothetical protein
MCLATIEAAAAAAKLRGEGDPPPTPGPLLLARAEEEERAAAAAAAAEEEEAGLGIWNPSTAAPSCRRADAAKKPRRADRSCMGLAVLGSCFPRGRGIEGEEEVRRRSSVRGGRREGGD